MIEYILNYDQYCILHKLAYPARISEYVRERFNGTYDLNTGIWGTVMFNDRKYLTLFVSTFND